MKVFIITGASRGIGLAMAEQLISDDHRLFCISRKADKALANRHDHLRYLEFDLSCSNEVDGLMESICASIDPLMTEAIYLVNNAAVVEPLANIGQCSPDDLITNIQVNLLAPILLTSSFIQRTGHLQSVKRILNVSSASAKYLCPGMSCYSAAKAGLDTFSRSVALEQKAEFQIVSAWPGLVDTTLQEEARTTNVSQFEAASTFAMYKDKGLLKTPEIAAEHLIRLLMSDSFGQCAVVEDIYAK